VFLFLERGALCSRLGGFAFLSLAFLLLTLDLSLDASKTEGLSDRVRQELDSAGTTGSDRPEWSATI
jgi:hypothetical protein